MASTFLTVKFLALISLLNVCFASRWPSGLVEDPQTQLLRYHKGALLHGRISVNLIWYGFCVNRCGSHGSKSALVKGKNSKFAYIWVGNSETQCPGFCAWPFHQPVYGPQSPPLVAPNNDLGMDGMVINLSGLLAGTATNPFGNGFYQGPSGAPLEATSACPGVYAKGLTQVMLGSCWWTPPLVLATMRMVRMGGSTCFQRFTILPLPDVLLWSNLLFRKK
ncbi:UNVERIFIED_CONTAM: protein PHOSPHATE-INDUCED 1 [Sesamum latifolium]|uniref:Protein PHOSPHATE-INDUCED 1 n=1 Tax=Sesamum latifolium TaxID=2727402 RepID=A0AAW2WDA9_9LAMI